MQYIFSLSIVNKILCVNFHYDILYVLARTYSHAYMTSMILRCFKSYWSFVWRQPYM